MQSVIAAIVTLVIVAPLTWVFATLYHKKVSAAKIGNAEGQGTRDHRRSFEDC